MRITKSFDARANDELILAPRYFSFSSPHCSRTLASRVGEEKNNNFPLNFGFFFCPGNVTIFRKFSKRGNELTFNNFTDLFCEFEEAMQLG